MMRLVRARWASLAEVERLTRPQVMDACEWLEAYEQAEAAARERGQAESKQGGGRRRRR